MDNQPQFLGPNKVFGLTKEEFSTPSGMDVVRVQYEGEVPAELMSKKSFDALVTSEATDFNSLRSRKFKLMVPEIIKIISEYDIKLIELKPLLQLIGDSLQDSFERASNWLWTGDEKTWVPGMSFLNERTLLEAEKVLKTIPPKENGTQAAPAEPKTGGGAD